MKRYQIHVQARRTADIFIEAETEEIARYYVASLPHEHFHWQKEKPIEIITVEKIEIEPAVNRVVQAKMTGGRVHWKNLME